MGTFVIVSGILYGAIVHQLWRFYTLAALLVLNNISIVLLNLDGLVSFSVWFVTTGLLFIFSGLITLGLFIYQNPMPTEDI